MNSLNPLSGAVVQSSSSSSSSSSSVQLPHAPALSSFAERHLQYIALNRMNGSLFFYPTQPEDPLLNRLFSDQDINLLFNLFREYKIGDDLTWIDLLGLRCFDLLKQIEKIFGCDGQFTEKWCPVYFLGYVSLLCAFYIDLDASIKDKGASIKDEKVFITPKTFAKKLNELADAFDIQFKSRWLRFSAQEKLQEKAKALVEDWKKTSTLFGKFLILPNPTKLLCDQTVGGCMRAPEMIPKSKEERRTAIDQFLLYMKLHEEALEFGTKNGIFCIKMSFSELIQKMDEIRSNWNSSSQEALIAKGQEYFKELFSWKRMLHEISESNQETLQKAISGRLTHSSWRKLQGIASNKRSLPQPQFIDRLAQNLILGRLLVMLSSDYQRILENCILQSSDHDSIARANRLKHVANTILESSFQGDLALFEIRNRFKENLKASFSKLLADDISHMTLLLFERQAISEACLKLQGEIDAFLVRLDSEKSEALSLSQTELNFWAQAFILLHDLKILTLSESASHLESEIFPNQFLELFESREEEEYLFGEEEKTSLPNLEELPSIEQINLSSVSISDIEREEMPASESSIDFASPPMPSPSMVNQSVERVKQAQTISKNARKKKKKEKEKTKEILVERKSRKVERMLQELETSPSIPEKLKEILEEKKRIKVERILREMGLEPLPTKRRGKGGHKVWSDPQSQWGQTVIPEHDELKEGTRHAIVAQLMNRKDS